MGNFDFNKECLNNCKCMDIFEKDNECNVFDDINKNKEIEKDKEKFNKDKFKFKFNYLILDDKLDEELRNLL